MFYSPEKLKQKATDYCATHNLVLAKCLGQGTQGIVFSTDRVSAVKVHANKDAYARERDVYLRLKALNVNEICGLIVPRFFAADEDLLIIEMSMVSPPFIVDFGGAYLDAEPRHLADALIKEQWIADKKEQFGENWTKVSRILSEFAVRSNVFVADVNPGNIQFGI